MSSFLENLTWRRAVKQFDGSSVDTSVVVRAIVNAPSSFGLQPYRIVAVRSPELKKRLRAASFDQPQVTDCDTLFIFCARTDVETRAEEFLTATGAEGLRPMLTHFLSAIPDQAAWAARQAYIALGFGLAAAAETKLASCPMEGFIPSEVASILELPENLTPVVYLAVGQASGEETHPRFRFPVSDLLDNRM